MNSKNDKDFEQSEGNKSGHADLVARSEQLEEQVRVLAN